MSLIQQKKPIEFRLSVSYNNSRLQNMKQFDELQCSAIMTRLVSFLQSIGSQIMGINGSSGPRLSNASHLEIVVRFPVNSNINASALQNMINNQKISGLNNVIVTT